MFTSPNSNQDTPILSIDRPEKQPWWDKKGFIVASVFSVIWLAFIWDYLFSSGWWDSRHELSPAEFIGGLCGLFLPILLSLLVSSYFDRSAQLGYEAQTLRSYLNELIYPTNGGETYTRSITNALRTQVKDFKKVYNDVTTQTVELNTQIQQWSKTISKNMQQSNVNSANVLREISDSIDKLNKQSVQAAKQVSQNANSFNEQTLLLQKTIKESSLSLSPILNGLKKYTDEIKQTENLLKCNDISAKEFLTKTNETVKQFGTQMQQAKNVLETYTLTNKKQHSVFEEQLKQAQNILNTQTEALKSSETFLKKQEEILAQAKNSFKSHNENIAQTEESLKTYQQTLEKTLNHSKEKIQKLSLNLKENSTNAYQKIEETLQQLNEINTKLKETIDLGQSVSMIQAPVNNTETENKKTPVDFLQNASSILDKLQSFSIDMAHIFTPKAEDMLWKKYYDGDKAVFMRYISRMISETQHQQIKDLYTSNEDFKNAVSLYMNEFEDMTQMVQNEDENKLLMSILIGSDIGRLYMVLADVLKR